MTKRVLICDDSEDTRVLMAELLSVNGYDVVITGTGTSAIEVISKEQIDAALIDIGLPDMSGLEVARAVRDRAYPTRMIALTGFTQLGGEALAAGFDEHLVKPVGLSSLLRTLGE